MTPIHLLTDRQIEDTATDRSIFAVFSLVGRVELSLVDTVSKRGCFNGVSAAEAHRGFFTKIRSVEADRYQGTSSVLVIHRFLSPRRIRRPLQRMSGKRHPEKSQSIVEERVRGEPVLLFQTVALVGGKLNEAVRTPP